MAYLKHCRIGETVLIGNDIVVTVVESDEQYGVMKLAIDAPKELHVRKLKEELAKRYPRTLD